MLSSFSIAVAICFFGGAIILVALAARARTDHGVARVLYDTERPARTR